MSMIVGLARLGRVLTLAFAVTFLAASCGDEQPELTLPDVAETTTPTTEAVDPPETADTSTTTQPPTDSSGFTPATVQFDPDNPPAYDDVVDLVYQAVEADYDNRIWCWENTEVCDADLHLGAVAAGPRVDDLAHELEEYIHEGGIYSPGESDGIYPVETLVANDLGGEFDFGPDSGFRILGDVVACEAYSGLYFVPDEDGGVGELLRDTSAAALYSFNIWQDKEGTLRVGNRNPQQEGGVELCGPFEN